jgi:hypothetical protein
MTRSALSLPSSSSLLTYAAQAELDFTGKTITIVSSFGAGGGGISSHRLSSRLMSSETRFSPPLAGRAPATRPPEQATIHNDSDSQTPGGGSSCPIPITCR